MTLRIYYGERNNIFVHEPASVFKEISPELQPLLNKCPAFQDYLKNVFSIKSPFNYELNREKDKISSTLRDQEFFNKYVTIRDIENGLCSFHAPKYYFYAEKPVLMRQQPAQYHNSPFARNTMLIGGEYDIGKHFRKMESSFYFRDKHIPINAGDALYYLKFCTDEKIKFIPFQFTKELAELISVLSIRDSFSPAHKLDFWYDLNKKFFRKRILKIIKANLLV